MFIRALFTISLLLSSVCIKAAQAETLHRFSPPIVTVDELSYDSNGHLAENYLLISSNPSCIDVWEGAWTVRRDFAERTMVAMSDDVLEFFASSLPAAQADFEAENAAKRGDLSMERTPCNAICIDRGVERQKLEYVIPDKVMLASFADPNDPAEQDRLHNQFVSWLEKTVMQVEIGFINWTPNEAKIYWVDKLRGDEEILVADLLRRERNTQWQTTTLGHHFRVVDAITNEVIGDFVARYPAIHVLGQPTDLEGLHPMTNDEVGFQVKNTFVHEWTRANRVTRTFTSLGFSRGRLPHDLWASIATYYYNNRNSLAREEWSDKGVFVNWWDAESYMIGMPWKLKTYWQSRLKKLVEQWAGIPLELTDIYGMRRYEDGARLLTHVDREETHAASLIINIAQIGMRQPWMLEIYDFAGRLHEVPMDEGDIVYYESARCLHGRMKALHGKAYVNLFAHYRPIGDPKWYTRSNPPGTPEQCLDVDTSSENVKQLFRKYISPSGQVLTGAETLWNYWKAMGEEAHLSHGQASPRFSEL